MADIIIIGGGVIGASTAFQLARRGAKDVLLLEAKTICAGETQKSGGFVQTLWPNIHEVRLIAKSREMFRDWANVVGGDCGWTQGGYLNVTGRERESAVRAVYQMLIDEGLPAEWLDAEQLARLQPMLNMDGLSGASWEPASGWANPIAATHAFITGAQAQGVVVREGVRVTQILVDDRQIVGVETTQGRIAARVVLLAAGPWSLPLHLGEPLPIVIERGQVLYMNRPPGVAERELAFYDEITGLYTHPIGNKRLVGIDYELDRLENPDDYARSLDAAYITSLKEKLAFRFPALAGSEIVSELAGVYDFTPDAQPIMDGPIGGIAGYYVATGFNGTGFKSSPATGLGMAEIILDGAATSVDLKHLTIERFANGARPAPLYPPGAGPVPIAKPTPLPSLPPALVEKLEAIRAMLTAAERDQLLPYMASLGAARLPAFASMLITRPAEEVAAYLRTELAAGTV